jgi:hypothetical protein
MASVYYSFDIFNPLAIILSVFLLQYWNKIGKIAVKAVPNPVKQMSKTILRHTLIKKYF